MYFVGVAILRILKLYNLTADVETALETQKRIIKEIGSLMCV